MCFQYYFKFRLAANFNYFMSTINNKIFIWLAAVLLIKNVEDISKFFGKISKKIILFVFAKQ